MEKVIKIGDKTYKLEVSDPSCLECDLRKNGEECPVENGKMICLSESIEHVFKEV